MRRLIFILALILLIAAIAPVSAVDPTMTPTGIGVWSGSREYYNSELWPVAYVGDVLSVNRPAGENTWLNYIIRTDENSTRDGAWTDQIETGSGLTLSHTIATADKGHYIYYSDNYGPKYYPWVYVSTENRTAIDFTATPLTGPVPLTVTLTDSSYDATTWNWTVVQMDGRNDFVVNITAQNLNVSQVKLFAVGNYSVTDTITNSSGSSSLTKYAYIYVYPNNSVPDSVNFTLTLTPSTIPFNGTMTGTISGGDSSLVNAISMTSGVGFSANGNDPAWVLSSGTWKQYNATSHAYDISWGASMPSTFTLTGFTTPGTYTMDAALYPVNDSFVIPHATAAFTVQSNGQTKKLTMRAVDGLTSGTIYGATVAVKLPDGTWSNKTQSGSSVEYQIPYGSYIQYTSSATGYYPSGPYYVQILKDSAIDVPMDKIVNTTIGTVQLSVYTMTPSGSAWKALEGVSLRVDPGGFAKTSPVSGVSTFTVNNSSTYTVTGQKTGYGTVTRSIAVGSTQASLSIEMYPLTATPTPDPTGPTTAPTIDTRTNAEKQQGMLNLLYDNGEAIIGLFILMIFMGGLQMMSGGGRRKR